MSRVNWLRHLLGTYIVGALAIGRFYDSRLMVGTLNVAFVVMLFYLLIMFVLVSRDSFKLKSSILGVINIVMILLMYQTALFLFFGVYRTQFYTFHKVLNFVSLAILPGIIFSTSIGYKLFVRGLKGFTSIFFLIGLIYILLGKTGDRLAVLGGGPIVFARWISVFVLLVLTNKSGKIYKLIYSSLGIFMIIAAGSKGPFVAFIIAGSFLIWRKIQIRGKIILVSALVSCLILASSAGLLSNSRVTNGLDNPQNLTSVLSRLEKLEVAKQLIVKYPLGIGFGNYPRFGVDLNESFILEVDYPHNIFAEIAVEAGLPWLIVFLISLLIAWQSREKNKDNGFIEALFLLFLINTQFSGDLSNSKFLIITMLILIFGGREKKTNLV